MTFPVLVTPSEGQFAATLVGAPDVCIVAPTRDQAVDALKAKIAERVARGELISVEVYPGAVTDLAGKYADDPTLREICADVYRQRDAEARE